MKRLIDLAMTRPETRFWYADQRKALKAFCKRQNWDFNLFADVLAITSPRVHLLRNFKLTCNYMQGREFYTTPIPGVVASLKHYKQTGRIKGPKTSRFALALRGKQDVVVLDVWMARILRVEYNHKFYKPKIYASLSKRVERVAEALEWTPAQTQAALWGNYLLSQNRILYDYASLIS